MKIKFFRGGICQNIGEKSLEQLINEFVENPKINVLSISDPCITTVLEMEYVVVMVRYEVGERAAVAPGDNLSIKDAVWQLEGRFIRAALERTKGNSVSAARLLEISPRALHYKMLAYGIE